MNTCNRHHSTDVLSARIRGIRSPGICVPLILAWSRLSYEMPCCSDNLSENVGITKREQSCL